MDGTKESKPGNKVLGGERKVTAFGAHNERSKTSRKSLGTSGKRVNECEGCPESGREPTVFGARRKRSNVSGIHSERGPTGQGRERWGREREDTRKCPKGVGVFTRVNKSARGRENEWEVREPLGMSWVREDE